MKHLSKTILSVFFCVFLSVPALRAQQQWQWGKRGNGNGSPDNVTDMATDPNGNIYLLTALTFQGDVDGQPLVGQGNGDFVVSSFGCDGRFRWKKIIGGSNGDMPVALKTDSLGGVYVLGFFGAHNTQVHIGTDTVIAATNKTIALIKYDTSGMFKWLRMPQADTVAYNTNNISHGVGMDTDGAGNVYVLGNLFPGNYGGSPGHVVTARGAHILKYDRDGQFLGGLGLPIATNDYQSSFNAFTAPKMKRDPARDRYYFASYFFEQNPGDYLRFGTTDIANNAAYLACYDGSGSPLWVKQTAAATNAIVTQAPALDPQGNLYVGGYAVPGVDWDGYMVANGLGNSMVPFILKKDMNGNNIWGVNAATTAVTQGSGIAYYNNTVYLSGSYPRTMDWGNGYILLNPPNTANDLYLARFDAQTGAVTGLDSIKSSLGGLAYGNQLITDNRGNAFMTARFNASVSVAGSTLSSASDYDWMVAKFGGAVCDCRPPVASFDQVVAGGNTVNFTYTGTAPYTQLRWDFGDGSPVATTANPSHTYSAAGNYTVCVDVTTDCGAHAHCHDVSTVGIAEGHRGAFSGTRLYPNPAARTVTIANGPKGATLEIFDAVGRAVLRTVLKGDEERVDVGGWQAGMYLARFTDTDGRQGTIRFVKE